MYFPAIYNEVTQRYKRYKNISNEELENIKIEILKNIVFNKNDIETPNINYNNLNNNNEIYPNQSNEINEQNLEINFSKYEPVDRCYFQNRPSFWSCRPHAINKPAVRFILKQIATLILAMTTYQLRVLLTN